MNNLDITVKELRTEGSGLLKDNWVRAFAVFTSRVLGAAIFLMVDNLISTVVVNTVAMSNSNMPTPTAYSGIRQYIEYRMGRGILPQDIVTVVLAIFYFLFISPLTLGCTRWYHSLAMCDNLQVGQVFHFYRGNDRFVEALVFELNRLERHVAAILLSFAPSAACLGAWIYITRAQLTEYEQFRFPLLIGAAALAVVGLIVYALWIIRYFLAKYLIVSDRKMEIADAFKTSVSYMKGMHGKVLRLILSFFPMFLMCVFLAPAFVVFPIYETTMAACALDIIDSKTPV